MDKPPCSWSQNPQYDQERDGGQGGVCPGAAPLPWREGWWLSPLLSQLPGNLCHSVQVRVAQKREGLFKSSLLEAANSLHVCSLLFRCLLKSFYLLGNFSAFWLAPLWFSFGTVFHFPSCFILFFFFKAKAVHTRVESLTGNPNLARKIGRNAFSFFTFLSLLKPLF